MEVLDKRQVHVDDDALDLETTVGTIPSMRRSTQHEPLALLGGVETNGGQRVYAYGIRRNILGTWR
jgi:hypothetical protein